MSSLWLPEGVHHDLKIERAELESAGAFAGGGWKLCEHITVSPWERVDAMFDTLRAKRAAPHFVIGGRAGERFPVVIQMLPLNVAGRALEHNLPEPTNGANCIQIEICAGPGPAAGSESMRGKPGWKDSDLIDFWPTWRYKALANLLRMIDFRVPIPRRQARSFQNTRKFSGPGFVSAKGHLGHMHVPGNSHIDPTTAFRGDKLLRLVKSGPHNIIEGK
jgi:hypothetical protein